MFFKRKGSFRSKRTQFLEQTSLLKCKPKKMEEILNDVPELSCGELSEISTIEFWDFFFELLKTKFEREIWVKFFVEMPKKWANNISKKIPWQFLRIYRKYLRFFSKFFEIFILKKYTKASKTITWNLTIYS